MGELKNFEIKENTNYIQIIIDNRDYIFPGIFYICGLLIGTVFFGNIDSDIVAKIITLTTENNNDYLTIFINLFCSYFSIYVVTVLLGLCLIGFPFVNILPLVVGALTGIKLAFYYVTYSVKGIGYSLLMIIPEITALVTVLLFTIKCSNELSKYIYDATTKKIDTIQEFNLKSYLKSFLLYGLIIVIIAVVNAVLQYLLQSIIQI
ncbi:MAG: stage II sporulation protein M [Eubacterium sp.]